MKTISSATTFLIIYFIINLLNYPLDTKLAVYIASVGIIFQSMSETVNSLFRAHERMEFEALTKIVRVSARFLVTIPLLFLGFGLIPVIVVYAVVQFLSFFVSIVIYYLKISKPELSFNLNLIKHLIKKGFPFALSAVFVVIYFRIDITMLSLMKGDSVVGWYSAAYNLIDALTSIPIALSAALLPVAVRYYNVAKQKLVDIYTLSTRYLTYLSFPIATGTVILADKIILSVYGEKYINSVPALQILVAVLVPLFIVYMMGVVMIAIHKEKIAMWVLFFNCVVNITLNLVLIPKYSLVGAAIATIVSEIFYLSMYHFIISKYFFRLNIASLVIRPFFASMIMGVFVYYARNLNLFIVVFAAALVYAAVVIMSGGLSLEDKKLFFKLLRRRG